MVFVQINATWRNTKKKLENVYAPKSTNATQPPKTIRTNTIRKKATAITPLTLSVGKIARDGDLSLGLLIWQCRISPNPN